VSRFQPRRGGGIQTTFGAAVGPISPNAADAAFAAQQQLNYDACNALISGISFFLPSGSLDAAKNDRVQTQLLGIYVQNAAENLPAGTTVQGWLGQVNWSATLAARKSALATF